MTFRPDLYRGTAPFYDRYRPPYPPQLLDELCARLPVSGSGRLLDLACGTGQIAFPLASRFAEVVAVDQEPETVAFARAKAEAAEVGNIVWMTGAAETIELEGGFELIAVGNAFHRLNRPAVARRMRSWVQPGGGVALLWGGIPSQGERPWQVALASLVARWMDRLDTTDRLPAGWAEEMERQPHLAVLADAGFEISATFDVEEERAWTVESLAGFWYSTALLSRAAVGDQAAAFEADLGATLHALEPGGVFTETGRFTCELARIPAV